eukprot:m.363335 g.363335  ORF g.363335 m.363335 type:complete len:577 (+) comp22100_c0_seq1:811-2541(+)
MDVARIGLPTRSSFTQLPIGEKGEEQQQHKAQNQLIVDATAKSSATTTSTTAQNAQVKKVPVTTVIDADEAKDDVASAAVNYKELSEDQLEQEIATLTRLLKEKKACSPAPPSQAVSPFAVDTSNFTPEELHEYTVGRVVKQIEFYFGDRNFPTDRFLRKHTKLNEGGFIPLSVVKIHKKMKKITDDEALIAEAVKDNSVVELNAEGTALRRRFSPPKFHPEVICAATVVVRPRLGAEEATIDTVTSAFKGFGRICQVRPVSSMSDIPAEVLHLFTHWEPMPPFLLDIQSTLYLVEYDYADEAADVIKAYIAKEDAGEELVFDVHLLHKRRKPTSSSRATSPASTRSTATSPAMSHTKRGASPHVRRGTGGLSPTPAHQHSSHHKPAGDAKAYPLRCPSPNAYLPPAQRAKSPVLDTAVGSADAAATLLAKKQPCQQQPSQRSRCASPCETSSNWRLDKKQAPVSSRSASPMHIRSSTKSPAPKYNAQGTRSFSPAEGVEKTVHGMSSAGNRTRTATPTAIKPASPEPMAAGAASDIARSASQSPSPSSVVIAPSGASSFRSTIGSSSFARPLPRK